MRCASFTGTRGRATGEGRAMEGTCTKWSTIWMIHALRPSSSGEGGRVRKTGERSTTALVGVALAGARVMGITWRYRGGLRASDVVKERLQGAGAGVGVADVEARDVVKAAPEERLVAQQLVHQVRVQVTEGVILREPAGLLGLGLVGGGLRGGPLEAGGGRRPWGCVGLGGRRGPVGGAQHRGSCGESGACSLTSVSTPHADVHGSTTLAETRAHGSRAC